MLALPSPKRCGIEIQTNGRATPLDPGAGGWVGKGRAEKAEETSDAEIDLNFDVVQMGFWPEIAVFFAFFGSGKQHLLLEQILSVMNMVFLSLKLWKLSNRLGDREMFFIWRFDGPDRR